MLFRSHVLDVTRNLEDLVKSLTFVLTLREGQSRLGNAGESLRPTSQRALSYGFTHAYDAIAVYPTDAARTSSTEPTIPV